MNTALKEKMVEFYNTNAFTHNYIFGFRMNGNIWMVKVTSKILPFVLMLDKQIKMSYNKDRKEERSYELC